MGREISGKNFLGNFARELFRKTTSSILLFTEPRTVPQPFRRIIVLIDSGEQSMAAFRLALSIAEHDSSDILYLISVVSPLEAALDELKCRGSSTLRAEEAQQRLDSLLATATRTGRNTDTRVIESATGNAVSEFAKAVEADLFIVPASNAQADQQSQERLPRYMDWVLQAIPCPLWLARTNEPSLLQLI